MCSTLKSITSFLLEVTEFWNGQAMSLCKNVESWIPHWEFHEATLLGDGDSEKESVNALLSNQDYMKLSALASTLDAMIASFKALRSDKVGPIITPEDLNKLQCLKASSIHTVTVTFVLFKLLHTLPKIVAPAEQAAETAKLLKQAQDKAPLPACLEEKLRSLAKQP